MCSQNMTRFKILEHVYKKKKSLLIYFLFHNSGSLLEASIAMWSIGGGNKEPGVLHSVCVELLHLETLLAFAYTMTCQSSSLVMWYAALL